MGGQERQDKTGAIVRIKSKIWKKMLSGFSVIVRLGLGCMFIYSSLPKIRQPYDFLHDVYNYEIVGPKLGMLTAMTLPWAELLVGICLVGGVFIGGALLVSVGLGAMFSVVLAWALYMGLDISCGCFSSSSAETISYMTLIRALVIMLLSGIAYLTVVFLSPGHKQQLFT
jgi:uncharacterized membrane protein YphA (DoxX/SURF4 family)